MSRGLLAWTIAACVHLSLSICGAAEVTPAAGTPVGAALAHYGFVSGADCGFSFFAPSVASLCRVQLTLRDDEGGAWEDTVFGPADSAFGLRSSAVFDYLPEMSERLRRGVTGSWAGVLFGRHPRASEVKVEVEVEDLPTMAEWRAGSRSRWIFVYEGTFVRNGPGEGPVPPR